MCPAMITDDHADRQHEDVGVLQDDVRDVAGAQRDAVGEDREQRDDATKAM
jgi:hypothetical protein